MNQQPPNQFTNNYTRIDHSDDWVTELGGSASHRSPIGSPERGFRLQREREDPVYSNSAFQEFRSQFQPATANINTNQTNPEQKLLSENMRSLNVPTGGNTGSGPIESSSTAGGHAFDYCTHCALEERSMTTSQRQHHLRFHSGDHGQQPLSANASASTFPSYASRPTYQSGFNASPATTLFQSTPSPYQPQTFQPSSTVPTPVAATVVGSGYSQSDDSNLYTTQPSRAVLSALKSLQDKLQELRVEKATIENKASRLEQDAIAREYELTKKYERNLNDMQAKMADSEANFFNKLKETREQDERLANTNMKLENEVRMLKENLQSNESEMKSLRDENHKLKLRINDAELDRARSQNESSVTIRAVEVEKAIVTERELEIQRLKQQVNQLASQLHQSQQQEQQLRVEVGSATDAREVLERAQEESQASIQRLAADLKIVSKDLLIERDIKQALLNYKYLTRDYVTSLLNLNYELCIDAGMSVRKRNDLLKHSQDLLQGLKKQAWSLDYETPKESTGLDDEVTLDSDGRPIVGSGFGSPQRKMNIGGVDTNIEEQKYLLASASSPEAIRVVHADNGHADANEENEEEKSSDAFGHGHSHSHQPQSQDHFLPTSPTVASTNKSRQSFRRSNPNSHTLQRDIALPFTVGKSTKQSFSVPVNVQEILSKQPSYYSKVAQKQVNQSRRRSGTGSVEEERIVVYPPPQAGTTSNDAEAEPVSLSAHSVGLSTVIATLENEVEVANRDYIHHLNNSRRDGDQDKQQLQQKLQQILKTIEKKNKQIQALKQHQQSVQGNHGVRLYSASTSASRNSRSGSTKKAGVASAASSRSTSRSVKRPSTAVATIGTASTGRLINSQKSTSRPVTSSTSNTDLADRHQHHQHGAQTSTPRKPSVDLSGETPHFGFNSPNSQRLLEKKIKSMRLLGQFKDLFAGDPCTEAGVAAVRFGSE